MGSTMQKPALHAVNSYTIRNIQYIGNWSNRFACACICNHWHMCRLQEYQFPPVKTPENTRLDVHFQVCTTHPGMTQNLRRFRITVIPYQSTSTTGRHTHSVSSMTQIRLPMKQLDLHKNLKIASGKIPRIAATRCISKGVMMQTLTQETLRKGATSVGN